MRLKQTLRTETSKDLYTDVNEFKKGYLPRTNLVEDYNTDLCFEHIEE
jgi:hypothetical protein